MEIIPWMSPITWFVILIPGFYMISQARDWLAWVLTSVAGRLVLFISGALITGKKPRRLMKEPVVNHIFKRSIIKQLISNALLSGLHLYTSISLAFIFMITVNSALEISAGVLILSFAVAIIAIGKRIRPEVTKVAWS